MTDSPSSQGALQPRQRLIVIASAVAVVVVGGIIVALAITSGGGMPGPRGTSGPASASPSTSDEPSAAPSPSEGVPASPSPTGNVQPAPSVAPLDATAEIAAGVDVHISRMESVAGEAGDPGEVAGPAIRFAVTVTNGSAAPVSMQTVAVTLDYGTERTPGLELQRPGGSPLTGEITPGATAEGIYIFTVPSDQRAAIRITVDYTVDVAPIIFEGAGPQ